MTRLITAAIGLVALATFIFGVMKVDYGRRVHEPQLQRYGQQ